MVESAVGSGTLAAAYPVKVFCSAKSLPCFTTPPELLDRGCLWAMANKRLLVGR